MSSAKFKKIRERLELTQEELAEILGFSGKTAISNIETGLRNPSKLAMAIMEVLNDLSPRKSQELMELLKSHVAKVEKSLDA